MSKRCIIKKYIFKAESTAGKVEVRTEDLMMICELALEELNRKKKVSDEA